MTSGSSLSHAAFIALQKAWLQIVKWVEKKNSTLSKDQPLLKIVVE